MQGMGSYAPRPQAGEGGCRGKGVQSILTANVDISLRYIVLTRPLSPGPSPARGQGELKIKIHLGFLWVTEAG
jgi:hypothetical protein